LSPSYFLLLIRFQAYHDPEDEPTAEPIDPSFFDFDSAVPLPKERLKGARANIFPKEPDCDQYPIGLALIYNEVINHHHKIEAQ
jgi:hypothetical protein